MAVPTTAIVTKYATFSFTPDDVNLRPSASSNALAGHKDSRVPEDINKGRIPWSQQFAVQEAGEPDKIHCVFAVEELCESASPSLALRD
jgi:hypothetical protein